MPAPSHTRSSRVARSHACLLVLLLATGPAVEAQTRAPVRQDRPPAGFSELSVLGGPRTLVGVGQTNYRVGSGVVVRTVTVQDDQLWWGRSELYGCEEPWRLSPMWISIGGRDDLPTQLTDYIDRSDKDMETEGGDAALAEGRRASEAEPTSAAVHRRLRQLCAEAGPEPRNKLVRLSQSARNDRGESHVNYLLTGSAERKGSLISVWMRSVDFKQVPMLGPDGAPLINPQTGKPFERTEAVGPYQLARRTFDCEARTMGVTRIVAYIKPGEKPETTDAPRLELQSVVPDSVGERMLEVVCKLYGRPKR